MNYPHMFRVKQVFDAPRVDDIEQTLARELSSEEVSSSIKPGARIAITAGSRGITNGDRMLKAVVQFIKEKSANPFLVPTMGSHGGGTAEGQLEILASLNITEESIGAPIISSMDVVEIGTSSFGFPVFIDAHAAEADGIVAVNRIKPHTEFEGPIESGLMKMLAIGMGNHRGCLEVHKQTVRHGYRDVIPEIGGMILEKLPVLFGVGIVENIYDETGIMKAIPAGRFYDEEKALLGQAKRLMARLPFDEADVLILDEMGKNISGAGMDTNVIGRIMFIGEREPESPKISRIVVLNLTEESHGNAVGVGLADYTTQRLADHFDPAVTATNAITAMTPEKGRLPIVLDTDQAAVDAALNTIGAVQATEARLVHIKNTLEIGQLDVSQAYMDEVKDRTDLQVIEKLGPLSFDSRGELVSKEWANP
jgi:Lactate racemase N-terminal domain